MKKLEFEIEDLKTSLEKALGFGLKSLTRVGGGGAANFKAERGSDGLTFLVKCFPPDEREEFEYVAANLKAMEGAKVPERVFADECPDVFNGYFLLCQSWKPGEFINLATLTDGQWKAFVDDYLDLSRSMQSVVPRGGVRPLREWRDAALAMCRGLVGRLLLPVLEAMDDDDLEFRPELRKVIHGDFHRGNILFSEDRSACFIDLESCRIGYSAEDIAVCCLNAYDVVSDNGCADRMLALFGLAVRRLPYSEHEWRTAFNSLFLNRLYRMTGGFRRLGLSQGLKMRGISKVYESFRRRVDSAYRLKSAESVI